MSTFAVVTLLLYLAVALAGYGLEYLELSYLGKYGDRVPAEFEGRIDRSLLEKSRRYTMDSSRFGIISSACNDVLTILFFFAGALNVYNSWIVSLHINPIVSGILFFLLLVFADTLLTAPFSIYRTFRIEKKYGFNTMTPGLWVADLIKSLILSTILLSLIVSVGLWLIGKSPASWWLWVWLFFLAFSISMTYLFPYVIEPLFNKFSPVEDEDLATGIRSLTGKVGITISRILKMDASKRTKHTNAYFTGIGRVKRVVLFDTLLGAMSANEILSVVGHELGHWKKRHILKHLILIETISLVVLYLAFRLMHGDTLPGLFGIQEPTVLAKVALLGLLGSIASFPMTPVLSLFSRSHEREADAFACRITNDPDSMISALVKLSKDNLSNLHPHPLYSACYYSHPPVTERIQNIRNEFRQRALDP